MKKKTVFILLTLALLLCLFPTFAVATTSGQCGDNLYWSYEASSSILVIQGSGEMYDNINNSFGWWDALKFHVTEIILPEGLTSIGANAFSDFSGLKTITIPNNVTNIGTCAFYNCKGLTNITLSNSVTDIGPSAFNGCTSLESVVFPNGVLSIGDCAFYKCSSLQYVVISNDATTIGFRAFDDCALLTSITLPDTVTKIDRGAFYGCTGLTSFRIPGNVTIIGDCAFQGCSNLTNVTIPDNVTTIGALAFNECTGLTTITVPSSVTSIGIGAFSGNKGLEKVQVDQGNTSYTSIDGVLYTKDKKLLVSYPIGKQQVSYAIPNGVTTIGEHAFFNSEILKSIIIPNSVMSIRDAFYQCTALSDVYYRGTEEQRAQIQIENSNSGNDPLLNAAWHYSFDSFTGVVTYRDGRNVYLQNGDTSRLVLLDGSNSQADMAAIQKGRVVTVTGYSMLLEQSGYQIPEIIDTMITEVTGIEGTVTPTAATIDDLDNDLMTRLVQVKATKQELTTAQLQLSLDGYPDLTSLIITGVLSANDSGRILLDPTIAAEHVPGEPVRENEVPATCAAEGSYDEVIYCIDCGVELNREHRIIEKSTVHTPGEPVQENVTPSTGSTHGSYDEVVYCTVCHLELNRTRKALPKALGEFTLSDEPQDVTAWNGKKAIFSVTVNNTKGVKYQWYTRADEGAAWVKARSGIKATLSVKAELKLDGSQYYCEITTPDGKLISDVATLTVQLQAPLIKVQPKEKVTVKSGAKAKLTVRAAGVALSYQWFSRAGAGGEWAQIDGETKAEYTIAASMALNGRQYRCLVRNAGGEVYSRETTLTVTPVALTIRTQPKAVVTVKSGAKARISVKATGPNLKYQWYKLANGAEDWEAMDGQTKADCTFVATLADDGAQFRCRVWNDDEEKMSGAATLTVTPVPPKFSTHPRSATVNAGATVTFKAKASGGVVTYQWYVKKTADGDWEPVDGETGLALTVVAAAEMNGWQFRCTATADGFTADSKIATLKLR